MSGKRYRVVLEGSAEEQLAAMEVDVRAAVLVSVKCLETDPYIAVGGVNWKKSKVFRSLEKLGINLRIFKAFEIQKWRVFYYVDEALRTVLVKEIVPRRDDTRTYDDLNAPHIRRLKGNYQSWLRGRVQ